MNGRIEQPPDKGKTKQIPHQIDGLISTEIEIKQEPTVKLKTEDVNDMVTVPVSEHAASGSIVRPIGDEQTGDAYDFTDVCKFDEAKSELKMGNIEKGAKKKSAELSGKEGAGSTKDFCSSRKQASIGIKKKKISVATAKIKPNCITRSNKKKSIVSKKAKQYKCSLCYYTTSNRGHLNEHARKHTGEKPFPCTHCAKRFTRISDLQRHMRTHVSEFLFNCSNCLKGFSQSDEKVEHETKCKIRRYECFLCKEYSTFHKSKLEYHMRVHHTGEKLFGCNQCSKKFPLQIALKRHQKTHINPRPLKFKCSVCYRNFSQRIEKDEHEVKCKRRGYECYLCKEFTSHLPNNLKNHMRIHSGLKPFQCKICQKSFSQKGHLQKHLKFVHK